MNRYPPVPNSVRPVTRVVKGQFSPGCGVGEGLSGLAVSQPSLIPDGEVIL